MFLHFCTSDSNAGSFGFSLSRFWDTCLRLYSNEIKSLVWIIHRPHCQWFTLELLSALEMVPTEVCHDIVSEQTNCIKCYCSIHFH